MPKTIAFNLFPQGKRKALTMSYDDGVTADRRLVEIFNRHGIRGTFHLNSGYLGQPGKLEPGEVASLFKGHEVSAHSVSHPSLINLPDSVIVAEMLKDREALEALVGYPVRGMSYPFGSYSQRVMRVLAGLGFEYGRTVVATNAFGVPEDFLAWPATCHHNHRLMELGQDFLRRDERRNKLLLYVWGHSYQFDSDKNWDLIEQFCALVGRNDAIWYATNIEIVDYVKAIHSLHFSAALDCVYNPSATAVWMTVDEKAVQVPPGATMRL